LEIKSKLLLESEKNLQNSKQLEEKNNIKLLQQLKKANSTIKTMKQQLEVSENKEKEFNDKIKDYGMLLEKVKELNKQEVAKLTNQV